MAEAVKQADFPRFEVCLGRPCKELAETLGFFEATGMPIGGVPSGNQPSQLAASKREKRKASARDATSLPPIPGPSKKRRQDHKGKIQPDTLVFDAVVIKTPTPEYNLDLTRFMEKYEIERRKYSTALLDLEDKLQETGLAEPEQ